MFVFFSLSAGKRSVYLLPIYPPLSLLLAEWIYQQNRSLGWRLVLYRAVAAVAVATGVVLLIISFGAIWNHEPGWFFGPIASLLKPKDRANLLVVQNALNTFGAIFTVLLLVIAGFWLALAQAFWYGAIRRAAVVDLDVHQGDGTAAIFEADPDILTISLHGKNNFPFRKQQSKIDVEFADGTGDDEYLSELSRILPEVGRFSPDIVFFQSGVDALATDRLGKLSLTPSGMRRRDEMVLSLPFPLVVTLGGGYSDPIEATVEAHFATFISSSALRAASPVSARSDGDPVPNRTFPHES